MGKEMKEITAKINKTRSGFFEKTTKIDKPLAKLINKKGDKNQINKIRNEKERLQQTVRNAKACARLWVDDLGEMGRSLEKVSLSRMNQEEIEIMSNPITSTEIEAVIKKTSQETKGQDRMASQENSIKRWEKS